MEEPGRLQYMVLQKWHGLANEQHKAFNIQGNLIALQCEHLHFWSAVHLQKTLTFFFT